MELQIELCKATGNVAIGQQTINKCAKGQDNHYRTNNRQVFQGTMGSGNIAIGQQTMDKSQSARHVSIDKTSIDQQPSQQYRTARK